MLVSEKSFSDPGHNVILCYQKSTYADCEPERSVILYIAHILPQLYEAR